MLHSYAGKGTAFGSGIRGLYRKLFQAALFRVTLVVLAMFSWQVASAQQDAATPESAPEELQVNINEADAATIADILVGIGASRARAIVEYREENGPFTSLEDLTEVNGVGEATVNNNRERIRFD